MKPTAEYKLPASFTPQQSEQLFEEIVRLYDLADEVMEAVAKKDIINRDIQMELAKPFITQTINSTNILAAFYTEVVRGGRPITPELRDTFEKAFQSFFDALHEIVNGMEEKLLPNGGSI